MTLLPADYAICAITVVVAVTGIFRGFSGSLAFVAGIAAAVAAGVFSWSVSASITSEVIIRALVVLVVSLLAFGIARIIVRKCVNGLLAQPADAIFGFVVGVLAVALAVAIWARLGVFLEYSNIVRMAAPFVTPSSGIWRSLFGIVFHV